MRLFPYVQLGRLRLVGARVYVHWTVWALPILLLVIARRLPLYGVLVVVSYLTIVVVHEMGHALAARRFGVRASAIHLGFLHGRCSFELEYGFYEEKEELIVAWGGVLAQTAVALPILVVHAITGIGDVYPFRAIVTYLGYGNLIIAGLNLLPWPGADGERAWRLLPILWREWRAKRRGGPPRPKRGKLRAVK